MTRTLILAGGAIAAVLWLVHQPAYAHDTPHKQLVALIAICAPFLVVDVVLQVRKKRRARARSRSPQPQARTRARAGAGRW
jgi:hypothetical protein